MSSSIRRRALATVKLLLGIGLLAMLLLWRDNALKVYELLAGFDSKYLFALMAVGLVLRAVSAVKWWILLRGRGLRLSLARLLGLHFIGQFFSNFLPSMIGGDLTKIYLLGRQINSQSQSAASVFVDRFTGLLALIILVFAFSLINYQPLREPLIGLSLALTIVGCAILIIVLAYGRRLSKWGGRLAHVRIVNMAMNLIAVFYEELRAYRVRYGTLAAAFACSLVFYFLTSLSIYLSCRAVGYFPSFLDVALVTPIIFLATIVPVSPSNIGWWEWCVSLLLSEIGADMAEGVMVALTMRAVSAALSLIGGVLFLMEKTERVPGKGHSQV